MKCFASGEKRPFLARCFRKRPRSNQRRNIIRTMTVKGTVTAQYIQNWDDVTMSKPEFEEKNGDMLNIV